MQAPMTLSRVLFLRLLGAVFLIAFVSVGVQLDGLVGPDGILPLNRHLQRMAAVVSASKGTDNLTWNLFTAIPTLSWFLDPASSTTWLAGTGAAASVLLMSGRLQAPALVLCWLAYLSICHDTQRFLSFQWDTLLLEVGFAAILVAPWRFTPTRRSAMAGWWLLRFILFKLVFFGGLVKLQSGDASWWDGTALTFHYETQPLPNPLSWYVHHLPDNLHRASTLVTFLIELVLVFGIFGTATMRRWALVGIGGLMSALFVTGNYGFFQVLTLVLCTSLMDDDDWRDVLPSRWEPGRPLPTVTRPGRIAAGIVASLLLSVSLLGAAPRYAGVQLPPEAEAFHKALRPFRSVNQYGLFAVMTKTRPLPVLEARWGDGEWTELTWRFQTSDPAAQPPVIAPHMPRLDWLVWFAGLGNCQRNPWMMQLQQAIASGSRPVSELVGDLRLRQAPPTEVRSARYLYRFSEPDSEEAAAGRWWTRERTGLYCPPAAAASPR